MAKAKRKISPRSKPRRRAALAHRPAIRMPVPPAAQAVTVPLAVVAGEMQSFGKRRLDKLMDASSRMLAVRDIGDVTLIQSKFFLDTMEDYADEAWRMMEIWMQAFDQGYRPLRRLGEKAARELPLGITPSQTMADIAMSSAVVH